MPATLHIPSAPLLHSPSWFPSQEGGGKEGEREEKGSRFVSETNMSSKSGGWEWGEGGTKKFGGCCGPCEGQDWRKQREEKVSVPEGPPQHAIPPLSLNPRSQLAVTSATYFPPTKQTTPPFPARRWVSGARILKSFSRRVCLLCRGEDAVAVATEPADCCGLQRSE
ncbi:unnamed protein product [Pleuronectes platessa]|uniref:Uncharacterized protein n=1 Tax=Pleuronectes platessa TaxID=8262 RepID=A0A9N7TPP4_PLEPL|nr:unnamed protein product [Pleuronectes platessa]